MRRKTKRPKPQGPERRYVLEHRDTVTGEWGHSRYAKLYKRFHDAKPNRPMAGMEHVLDNVRVAVYELHLVESVPGRVAAGVGSGVRLKGAPTTEEVVKATAESVEDSNAVR